MGVVPHVHRQVRPGVPFAVTGVDPLRFHRNDEGAIGIANDAHEVDLLRSRVAPGLRHPSLSSCGVVYRGRARWRPERSHGVPDRGSDCDSVELVTDVAYSVNSASA